jgi:hypothetical protein
MPNPNNPDAIKITAEDLSGVAVRESAAISLSEAGGGRVYGTINETAEQLVSVPGERGSILLQGWFYLGLAGLLGALAGWAIAEPGFIDGPRNHQGWGNIILLPLIVTLMSMGFGISESTAEHSLRKALLRGALALPLGIILGFVFDMMANTIYAVLMGLAYEAGAQTNRKPAVWILISRL